MATTDFDSDSENEVNSELNSHSILQNTFDELLCESTKLAIEYKSLKKKYASLEKSFDVLKKENEDLKTEIKNLVNQVSVKECSSSKYKKSFQKFLDESVTRSKMTSLIYGNNGNINKFGLGYEELINSNKPSSSSSSPVNKPVSKTPSSGQTVNQKHVHCTY